MAEPDLLGLYGVETPIGVEAAERERRASMTHQAAPAGGFGGFQASPSIVSAAPAPQPLPPTDAELTALVQQAEAQNAPPVLQGTEALGAAMAGGEADLAFYQRQIDANQPFTTSRANPLRPQAERRAREQLTGDQAPIEYDEFVAQPFDTPTRQPGEGDAQYMERVQLAKMAHDVEQEGAQDEHAGMVQGLLATPDRRFVGQPGEVGMLEGERRASEDVAVAQAEIIERGAAAQTEAAIAERSALAQAKENMQVEREFQEDQRDALLRMKEVESNARAKLEALPDFETNRYSANMGAGQKFLALLAGVAGGWTGNPGAATQRMDQLDRKALEEQKLNYEMGLKSYDAATGAVEQGMNLFGMLANELGDPAAAEAMFLDMAGQDRSAMFEEQLAGAAGTEQQALLQQEQLIHEQGLRDRRDLEEQRLMAQPENIVTRHDPGRRARRAAEKQIEKEQDFRRDMRARGVDIGVGREEQEGRVELEGVKQRGAARTATAKVQAEGAQKIKEQTRAYGQVRQVVDELLAKRPGELYTVGIPGMGTKGQRITEEAAFLILPEMVVTALTGASAPPETIETAKKLVEGDWSDFGDEDRKHRLRALSGLMGSQERFLMSELGSSQAPIESTADLKSFKPL